MIRSKAWENDYAVTLELDGTDKPVLDGLYRLMHEFFRPQIRKAEADASGAFKIVFDKSKWGSCQINPTLGHVRGIVMTMVYVECDNLKSYVELDGPTSEVRE